MLSVEKTLKQEIEQWKHEYEVLDACCELAQSKIEELKAENDRLKEEVKEVKKYQYEQEYLEKEIETAKVNLDIGKEEARHYLHEAYKFQKCLQEIKKYIAKICKEECGYVQKKRCPDCDCRYGAILDLITKAEEE